LDFQCSPTLIERLLHGTPKTECAIERPRESSGSFVTDRSRRTDGAINLAHDRFSLGLGKAGI